MTRRLIASSALAMSLLAGCSDYREETNQQAVNETAHQRSPAAVASFRAADPTLNKYFDSAYAYAVFPEIAKGAAGVGAANGSGSVYQGGVLVGFAEMTQVTLGAQVGGQTFRELIFFQNAEAFNKFKRGGTKFAANASAVMVRQGAAAANDYREGVAVFVMPMGGAMLEASIGGQEFTFRPLAGASITNPKAPYTGSKTTTPSTTTATAAAPASKGSGTSAGGVAMVGTTSVRATAGAPGK